MNNDLSDKALNEWWDKSRPCNAANAAWQECRRRAEALERKAFEAGFLSRLVKNWSSEEAWQVYKEQN